MGRVTALSDLRPGEQARVISLRPDAAISGRLCTLGLVEGTMVTCLLKSPLGEPTAYLIRGAVIALRCEDAACVTVRGVDDNG